MYRAGLTQYPAVVALTGFALCVQAVPSFAMPVEEVVRRGQRLLAEATVANVG